MSGHPRRERACVANISRPSSTRRAHAAPSGLSRRAFHHRQRMSRKSITGAAVGGSMRQPHGGGELGDGTAVSSSEKTSDGPVKVIGRAGRPSPSVGQAPAASRRTTRRGAGGTEPATGPTRPRARRRNRFPGPGARSPRAKTTTAACTPTGPRCAGAAGAPASWATTTSSPRRHPWKLDAGLGHTCGVTTNGVGWCWGWNDHGQLGDGSSETIYFPEPKSVQLPGTWTDVAAGFFGSVGTKVSGTPWAWGNGAHGELGNGPSDPSLDPVRVPVAP